MLEFSSTFLPAPSLYRLSVPLKIYSTVNSLLNAEVYHKAL